MQEDLFGICPYVTAQKLLTGKWTLLIMHHLSINTMRFNELQRALPDLTQATLTKQLRMMEKKRPDYQNSIQPDTPKGRVFAQRAGVSFQTCSGSPPGMGKRIY